MNWIQFWKHWQNFLSSHIIQYSKCEAGRLNYPVFPQLSSTKMHQGLLPHTSDIWLKPFIMILHVRSSCFPSHFSREYKGEKMILTAISKSYGWSVLLLLSQLQHSAEMRKADSHTQAGSAHNNPGKSAIQHTLARHHKEPEWYPRHHKEHEWSMHVYGLWELDTPAAWWRKSWSLPGLKRQLPWLMSIAHYKNINLSIFH